MGYETELSAAQENHLSWFFELPDHEESPAIIRYLSMPCYFGGVDIVRSCSHEDTSETTWSYSLNFLSCGTCQFHFTVFPQTSVSKTHTHLPKLGSIQFQPNKKSPEKSSLVQQTPMAFWRKNQMKSTKSRWMKSKPKSYHSSWCCD